MAVYRLLHVCGRVVDDRTGGAQGCTLSYLLGTGNECRIATLLTDCYCIVLMLRILRVFPHSRPICGTSNSSTAVTSSRSFIYYCITLHVLPSGCYHYWCSVIRLSLGELLVNLLQVVKRTNTPLDPNKWRRRQTMVFLGRGFKSHIQHNKLFLQTFPMSNLKNTLPGIPKNEINGFDN